MLMLEVAQDGTVRNSSMPLRDGINVIGSVVGVFDPDTLEARSIDDVESGNIPVEWAPYFIGDAIIIHYQKGRVLSIAPDLGGVRDVFWVPLAGGGYRLSDDFFVIAPYAPSVGIRPQVLEFFVTHGQLLPGDTLLDGLRRVSTGRRLCFTQHNDLEEVDAFVPHSKAAICTHDYAMFRKALLSTMALQAQSGRRRAILLSGGCDSGLLAGLDCRRGEDRPMAVTYEYQPGGANQASDIAGAELIADRFGLEHCKVSVTLDSIGLNLLDPIICCMPMAAHLGLGQCAAVQKAAELGAEMAWCGQNADALYNLGPTAVLQRGGGKEASIKRFFLTRQYLSTLKDIEGGGVCRSPIRLLGQVGVALLSRRMNTSCRQPETFVELEDAFFNSDRYVALPCGNRTLPSEAVPSLITTLDARRRLFSGKLGLNLAGRNPRIIYTAGMLADIHIAMPFSAGNMIHFFRDLEMSWGDVIYPKEFVYRFYVDLIGRRFFYHIQHQKRRATEGKLSKNSWESHVLQNTGFGRELSDCAAQTASRLGCVKGKSIQSHVSLFWLDRVEKKLKERDVSLVCDKEPA